MTAISDMARFFRYGVRYRCPVCTGLHDGDHDIEGCYQEHRRAASVAYVYRACPDAGFLGELLRAISDRLSRLVGPGDVGVVS